MVFIDGRRALWLALASSLLASCTPSQPSFDGTSFRCDDGVCPAGFECVAAICVNESPPGDSDAAPEPDIDAGPEPDIDAGPEPDIDAAPEPGIDAAPPAPDLIVDGVTEQLESGTYEYSSVQVINGGVLTVVGAVEIRADSVVVDADSQIDGSGRGYGVGLGPGAGSSLTDSGSGGGGHGGRGGRGGALGSRASGGASYGTQAGTSIDMGSGGAGPGGAGGGALTIRAATINVRGALRADGLNQAGFSGGGGAGGGVLLVGDVVSVIGTVSARGGSGLVPEFRGIRPRWGAAAVVGSKSFWDTECACSEGSFDVSPGTGEPGASGTRGEDGAPGTTHMEQQPYSAN